MLATVGCVLFMVAVVSCMLVLADRVRWAAAIVGATIGIAPALILNMWADLGHATLVMVFVVAMSNFTGFVIAIRIAKVTNAFIERHRG